jgi:broad specificity phosphatase PhoE
MKADIRIKNDIESNLPEGAETYKAFETRVINAFRSILVPSQKPPLIVGHGGVFLVLTRLLSQTTLSAENCALYYFRPPEQSDHPWSIINLIEQLHQDED